MLKRLVIIVLLAAVVAVAWFSRDSLWPALTEQWTALTRQGPADKPAAMAEKKQDAGGKPAAAPPRRATAVEARLVNVSTMTEDIVVIGTLRSNENVVIRPEMAGRIERINFKEGERVKKGQLLFALDAKVLEAELGEARASLVSTKRDFERSNELYRKGAGTARQRDDALGKLEVDQARLALAEARLERTRIYAPFDGIIGLRQVSIGSYVLPGVDLVNLENLDPIKVEFRVPEVHLRMLREGMKLDVQVDALPGEHFAGSVYAIDPRFDAEGRSVALRATIPNSGAKLRPGLFARVSLNATERSAAITIPEQSVFAQGEDQYVYRVVDGQAKLTKVVLGLRRQGEVEVVDGLTPEDVVVTAGHQKLREGAAVKVMEEPGQAKANS